MTAARALPPIGIEMAITESDMNALREIFREANETLEERLSQRFVTEVGKANQALEAHLGARFEVLEKAVNGHP